MDHGGRSHLDPPVKGLPPTPSRARGAQVLKIRTPDLAAQVKRKAPVAAAQGVHGCPARRQGGPLLAAHADADLPSQAVAKDPRWGDPQEGGGSALAALREHQARKWGRDPARARQACFPPPPCGAGLLLLLQQRLTAEARHPEPVGPRTTDRGGRSRRHRNRLLLPLPLSRHGRRHRYHSGVLVHVVRHVDWRVDPEQDLARVQVQG